MTSTDITLVTGATGHLGANLVRTLIARNERVRVLLRPGRDERAVTGLNVERVYGDLTQRDTLRRAVQGCRRVYHLAAHISLRNVDQRLLYDVNILGTRHLMTLCRTEGIERVVHCSSFGAVGRNPNGPSDEQWSFDPCDDSLSYERSKAFAELEVLKAVADGLDAVIVNPSGLIGPWDFKPSFVGRMILDFAHGRMKAYVPGAFDFVSIADVVDGHLLAMERGKTGQRYLLTGEQVTIDQILHWLADATGRRRPRVSIPPRVMQPVAIVKDWLEDTFFPQTIPRFNRHTIRLLNSGKHGSNERARKELGLSPSKVRSALTDAVQWFRDQQLLSN